MENSGIITIEALKQMRIFINFKLDKSEKGNVTKPPVDPTDCTKFLNILDSTKYVNYYTAMRNQDSDLCDGVGMVLTSNDNYALCGIDIDEHKDETNFHIEELKYLFEGTYMEFSPSGKGLHILFLVNKEKIPSDYSCQYLQKNSKEELECYVGGIHTRYLTFTENTHGLTENPIVDMTNQFLKFINKYMIRLQANEIVETRNGCKQDLTQRIEYCLNKARSNKSYGEQFVKLYDKGDITGYSSESEARQRLCGFLAFWLGKDKDAIKEALKKSALYRADKEHDACIDKAIATCSSYYSNCENPINIPYPNSVNLLGNESVERCFEDFNDSFKLYDCTQSNNLLNEINIVNPVDEYYEKLKLIDPDNNVRYNQWNDTSNAELFAKLIEDEAMYACSENSWYIFDEGVWKKDTGAIKIKKKLNYIVEALNKYFQRVLKDQINNLEESISLKDKIEKIGDILNNWADSQTKRNLINDAKPYDEKDNNLQFDENDLLFNVSNGSIVLDERGSFYFKAHSPTDYCTKKSPVTFNPNSNSGRWEKHVDEIMQGDKEKAKYLKKLIGYCLSGKTYEDSFFLFLGPTRTGKSTFINSVESIFADYGVNNQNESILKYDFKSPNGHSEHLARLYNKRLFTISELPQDAILDYSLIRQMTGKDKLTARKPYEKSSFEFYPKFKLIIVSNYALLTDDSAIFESNRLKVIPFENRFIGEKQNAHLMDIFQTPEMQSEILNWALEGWVDYCNEGLNMPASIEKATQEYYSSQDSVASFIEECLVETENGEINFLKTYQKYCFWMARKKGTIMSKQKWKSSMEEKGIHILKKRPKNNETKGATSMIVGYEWNEGN